jgi:S1-C subfamily serine protease
MRKLTSLLAASLFFALLASAWAGDIRPLVQKAKPAVVQIGVFDNENKLLQTGTGFFITADGYLLTNYHVIFISVTSGMIGIKGANAPPITQPQRTDSADWSPPFTDFEVILAKAPNGTVYHLKRIAAMSPQNDVVLLQFDTKDVPYLSLGSTANIVEGERVLVVGNPEGLEFTVSDGIISAFRDNRSLILITAPISHGSSGSPVLDCESGQVLGIVKSVYEEGQNLNFAICSETVRDAIAKSLEDRSRSAIPAPSAVAQEK